MIYGLRLDGYLQSHSRDKAVSSELLILRGSARTLRTMPLCSLFLVYNMEDNLAIAVPCTFLSGRERTPKACLYTYGLISFLLPHLYLDLVYHHLQALENVYDHQTKEINFYENSFNSFREILGTSHLTFTITK